MRWFFRICVICVCCVHMYAADAGNEESVWSEADLRAHIESGYGAKSLPWQVTSFGTYNTIQEKITISTHAVRLAGVAAVSIRIEVPCGYYDRLAASILAINTSNGHNGDTRVRSRNLQRTKDEVRQVYIFSCTCEKKYMNASFLYLDGWKNGTQSPLRIWLCGFEEINII